MENMIIKAEEIWGVKNGELWSQYLSANEAESKKIEMEFLETNIPMFLNILKNVNIRNHVSLASKEDVFQTIYMEFISVLRKKRNEQCKEYPATAFKIVENETKRIIKTDYTSNGIKMSYATRKRFVKSGKNVNFFNEHDSYEKIVHGADDYDVSGGEKFDKIHVFTESVEDMITDINSPETKSYIREVLYEAIRTLPETERKIIFMRHIQCQSYKSIGSVLGMPMYTVRKKHEKCIAKLEKLCKQQQLDAYL